MSSPPTDRKSLKVTVFLRDGTKTELTEDVSNGGGDAVDLKLMSKAVETLQTRTNAELTRLVELEKQSGAASNKNNTNGKHVNRAPCNKVRIFIYIMLISSPNPSMFDHLFESSHRDDSNKWSNRIW